MRQGFSTITAAEQGAILQPVHGITFRRDLLSFPVAPTTVANGAIDATQYPSLAFPGSSTDRAYVVFRDTSGNSRVAVLALTSSAGWGISTSTVLQSAASVGCVRGSVFKQDDGAIFVYTATGSGSTVQVQRANVTAQTSNPMSISLSSYGDPIQLVNTFGLVTTVKGGGQYLTRVEAVCPTDAGVIVCVGTHDTESKKTILYFYIVQGAATRLATTYQVQTTETYVSWHTYEKYTSRVFAKSDDSGKIFVYFDTSEMGRTVGFTVQNYVCSPVEPVVYSDPEQTNAFFSGYQIERINNLYYMTGRLTKKMPDETTVAFDCYLTSEDMRYWSLGERSSFLNQQQMCGALALHGTNVYYVAPQYHTYAAASYVQNSSVGAYDMTSRLMPWNYSGVVDGADSLSLSLLSYGAEVPNIATGQSVSLMSGLSGNTAEMGIYSVDKISYEVSTHGLSAATIELRDLGNKRLGDWQSPVDYVVNGYGIKEYDLQKPESLIQKTKSDTGTKFTLKKGSTKGLVYTEINTPNVFLMDAPSDDGVIKTTVKFSVDDGYHLSSIGFIIGAYEDADGNWQGNVLFVPKLRGESQGYGGSWALYNKPKVRVLDLVPIDPEDKDKEGTGWNFIKRNTNAWMRWGNNTLITAAPSRGSHRYNPDFGIPVDTEYDLMVTTSGNRIRLYGKPHVTTSTEWAENASYTLLMEYESFTDSPTRTDRKCYNGIMLCTDTYGSTEKMGDSEYADLEVGMSTASNYVKRADLGQYVGTCEPTGGANIGFVNATRPLYAKQYLKLYRAGETNMVVRIVSKSDGTLNSNFVIDTTGLSGLANKQHQMYMLTDQDTWGEAGSGAAQYTEPVSGKKRTIHTGAKKRGKISFGKAAFASNDNTAVSIRMIQTDGVTHYLQSGSEGNGNTRIAWDDTNPLNSNTTEPFNTSDYGGSSASAWRTIYHKNGILTDAASSVGMPDPGGAGSRNRYIIVDDEIMRYRNFSFAAAGEVRTRTWCLVDTYYMPLDYTAENSTYLRQWFNGISNVGDQADQIVNVAGLAVKVTSKQNTDKDDEEPKLYYVLSVTPNTGPTSGQPENRINLTEPYATRVNATTSKDGELLLDSMLVLQGRAQFGTKKDKHDAETPVCYMPCDPSTGVMASINVRTLQTFSGSINTTEDILKRIASLAGVRPVKFRNMFTAANANNRYSFTVTTSATEVPLNQPLTNFVLDADVHIPGHNLTSGAVTSDNWLNIDFRAAYRLRIQQTITMDDVALNQFGNVTVALETVGAEISPYGGRRTLEKIERHIADLGFAGGVSGSGSNWVAIGNASTNQHLRVAVHDGLLAVELNGAPVCVFDISQYVLSSGPSMDYRYAGVITMYYNSAVSGNSCSVWVPELGDRVSTFVIRQSNTASAAIDDICEGRHIFRRSAANGGVQFAQFVTRDNLGTMSATLLSDKYHYEDEKITGHMQMTGKDSTGEYINPEIISAKGYKFEAQTNDLIEDAADAAREAALLTRLQIESSEQRVVEIVGGLAIQPEDEVTITYDAGSGYLAHTTSQHVVTSVDLTAEAAVVRGTMTVRKKA